MNMKPDFERNLFAKGGTHWSRDGAILVLDSLLKLIEYETGEARNKIQFTDLTKTQIPEGSDNDILKISNLMFENLDTEYYYPEYHFEKTYSKKGKLIAISDSFFWLIYQSGISNSFQNIKYWYYFNDVYPESYKSPKKVKDINISKELLEADVVLLMSSTSLLSKLGWGFTTEVNDLLLKGIDKEAAIAQIIAGIKSDPKWFASVKAKGEKRNIELDSMLRLDAEYLYNRK